jgi:hypothetical protein
VQARAYGNQVQHRARARDRHQRLVRERGGLVPSTGPEEGIGPHASEVRRVAPLETQPSGQVPAGERLIHGLRALIREQQVERQVVMGDDEHVEGATETRAIRTASRQTSRDSA